MVSFFVLLGGLMLKSSVELDEYKALNATAARSSEPKKPI